MYAISFNNSVKFKHQYHNNITVPHSQSLYPAYYSISSNNCCSADTSILILIFLQID